MKLGSLKSFFKISGVVFAVSGIICLMFYILFWDLHVKIAAKNIGSFPLTCEQRVEDFEYLYNILEGAFPYFEVKKRQYGIDWLARKNEFINDVSKVGSDGEFYSLLSEILSLLQNGHTDIIAPGSEFDGYKEIYQAPRPWSQVFGNTNVNRCYEYWRTAINEEGTQSIPVLFKYVGGDYYVYQNSAVPGKADDEPGIPMGSRLVEVDGTDVHDYIRSLVNKRILEYDPIRSKFKLNTFSINTENNTELIFITPEGERVRKVFKPSASGRTEVSRSGFPEHLYSAQIIDSGKTAYLKLPSFASSYVRKDREGIRTFLEQIRNYQTLIVDIRGNGGGSTDYWMDNIVPLLTDKTLSTKNYLLFRDSEYIKPFIKQKMFAGCFSLKAVKDLSFDKGTPSVYSEYGEARRSVSESVTYDGYENGFYEELDYIVEPLDPVGFRGKIFLLVDDKVYSSAEAFASFAKATGWAVLIGTRTGGDGIGFDPVPVALPNSGLVIRFPAGMGLNPDGSINEEAATMPDIYAEPGYEDFIHDLKTKNHTKYDTVFRKTLELADAD